MGRTQWSHLSGNESRACADANTGLPWSSVTQPGSVILHGTRGADSILLDAKPLGSACHQNVLRSYGFLAGRLCVSLMRKPRWLTSLPGNRVRALCEGSEFDHRTVNAAIRATLRRYRRPSLRIPGNLPAMRRLTGQGAAGLRAPYATNGLAYIGRRDRQQG